MTASLPAAPSKANSWCPACIPTPPKPLPSPPSTPPNDFFMHTPHSATLNSKSGTSLALTFAQKRPQLHHLSPSATACRWHLYPLRLPLRNLQCAKSTSDAGHRWEKHRDRRLIALRCSQLRSEPGAFCVQEGMAHATILCTTDDFLAFKKSTTLLARLRRQLQNEWDITI